MSERIRERTRLIGRTLLRVDRVASTNDLLRTLAQRGAPEGAVVVAREQSAGRGRMGRAWVSPPGGLWLSVLLRPADPFDPRLGLAAAVAAAEALRRSAGNSVAVKWPNDLVVAERKVGGVLVEAMARQAIVGIGVNVAVEPAALPPDVRAGAVSVTQAAGKEISLEAVLEAVLERLDATYALYRAGRVGDVLARWRQLSVTLGRPVRVQAGARVIEGRAADIDEDGALLVARPDGALTRVRFGDVTVLAGGGRP